MVTNNSSNQSAAGLANYNGTGTWTGVTVTNNDVLVGGASNSIQSIALTNGQLLIGDTGTTPVAATLTAGTGVTVVNGAGTITLNAIGGGLTWNDVTGGSASAAVNNGYLADSASLTTITLPVTAAQFSVVAVAGFGTGGWKLAQNASQLIHFGNATTTTGTGGSLASNNSFDCVYVLCVVANTTWLVLNDVGNITVT